MFSLMNIVEMAINSGESYGQIRILFLDAVGAYCLLSDLDPQTAWERERRLFLPPEVFLAPIELFGILFSQMPEGAFRLRAALERVQEDDFRHAAAKWLDQSKLARMLKALRKRYREGRTLSPSQYPKGTPIWIQDTLIQHLVRDGKRIDKNDVRGYDARNCPSTMGARPGPRQGMGELCAEVEARKDGDLLRNQCG